MRTVRVSQVEFAVASGEKSEEHTVSSFGPCRNWAPVGRDVEAGRRRSRTWAQAHRDIVFDLAVEGPGVERLAVYLDRHGTDAGTGIGSVYVEYLVAAPRAGLEERSAELEGGRCDVVEREADAAHVEVRVLALAALSAVHADKPAGEVAAAGALPVDRVEVAADAVQKIACAALDPDQDLGHVKLLARCVNPGRRADDGGSGRRCEGPRAELATSRCLASGIVGDAEALALAVRALAVVLRARVIGGIGVTGAGALVALDGFVGAAAGAGCKRQEQRQREDDCQDCAHHRFVPFGWTA